MVDTITTDHVCFEVGDEIVISPPGKPQGTMTVVSVDYHAGRFTVAPLPWYRRLWGWIKWKAGR